LRPFTKKAANAQILVLRLEKFQVSPLKNGVKFR
jgi:hypothetical protein